MKYKVNPLVSVIIPVYNVEKYLEECLNSVINQTYRNLEIILVDDGSTDNSSFICDKYVGTDDRIIVIHQKNMGLVGARKSGVLAATGDIATFVDSDDWLDLNMYEVMVKEMAESGADIVTSGLIREYERHFVSDMESIEPGTYSGEILEKVIKSNFIDTEKFFKSNISMHIYNKLFERKLLLKNELLIPENISIAEDAACVYPCILDADKITVIDRCFYHYRIRSNSIMGQSNDTDIIKIKALYQYLYHRFNSYPSKLDLERQLRLLIIYCVLLVSPRKLMTNRKDYLYYYPEVKKGMKIIIYGTGRAGRALMKILNHSKDYEIVGWIDKNNLECDFSQLEYDYVIIAVYLYSAYEDIYRDLIHRGVSKNKIAYFDMDKILNIPENFTIID